MTPADLRKQIPILNQMNPVRYFDSACQSLKPQPVIDIINHYNQNLSSCSGRSLHQLAHLTSKAISESRSEVALWTNVKPHEIVFTKNTTESINIIAHGLPLKPADRVAITDKEHNSNLLPWLNRGEDSTVVIMPTNKGLLTEKTLTDTLTKNKNIKLISLTYISNLDGRLNPINQLIKIAKKYNCLTLLDAAQVPLNIKPNFKSLGADFICFSGHKALAGSGTGLLYVRDLDSNPYHLKPLILGGGTIGSLNKFEAGSLNYASIISLKPAFSILNSLDYKIVRAHLDGLTSKLLSSLKEIKDIQLINPSPDSSIISFYIKNIDSHDLAIKLDQKYNLALRSGHFCCDYYFKEHRLPPALRISLAPYNNEEDINLLLEAIKKESKT